MPMIQKAKKNSHMKQKKIEEEEKKSHSQTCFENCVAQWLIQRAGFRCYNHQ